MLAVAIVDGLVSDTNLRDAALGDLAEEFDRIASESSADEARGWYWSQVIRSLVPLARLAMRGGLVPWLWLAASILLGYGVLAIMVIVTEFRLMAQLGGSAPWLMAVASLLTGAICACIAGGVAAAIARRSPLLAACALGLVCVAISAWLIQHGGDGSPLWYQVALMLIVLPSVLGGALTTTRVMRRLNPSNSSSERMP